MIKTQQLRSLADGHLFRALAENRLIFLLYTYQFSLSEFRGLHEHDPAMKRISISSMTMSSKLKW